MSWLRRLIPLLVVSFSLGFESTDEWRFENSTSTEHCKLESPMETNDTLTTISEENVTASLDQNNTLTRYGTSEVNNGTEGIQVCSHVALIYVDGSLSCNGVFLSRSLVLTTASEFLPISKNSKSGLIFTEAAVTIKIQPLYCDDPIHSGLDYPVEWVYFHPLYRDSKSEKYNLALLGLKGEINIPETSIVRNVASNEDPPEELTENMIENGSHCRLIGYSVFGNGITWRSLLCCWGGTGASNSLDRTAQDGSSSPAPTCARGFLLPPVRHQDMHKKCMVIDLDETLVHSSFKPINNADFVVPVEIDGAVHQVYVLKRPYVDDFLQRMGELYECILFTASLAKYADPVADLLDRWGVFRSRLFRESCVFYRGNYVKDLNKLGRELHKVVIVDNSPASYIFHPDNAVPVASWFDDMSDTEMLDLIPFFENLSRVDNVYAMLSNSNHPYNSSGGSYTPGGSIAASTPASSNPSSNHLHAPPPMAPPTPT